MRSQVKQQMDALDRSSFQQQQARPCRRHGCFFAGISGRCGITAASIQTGSKGKRLPPSRQKLQK